MAKSSSNQRKESQTYERHPFVISINEICQLLNTNNETGLDDTKVQDAQSRYEPNKLGDQGGVEWYSVLLKQVSNAMILVRFSSLPIELFRTFYHFTVYWEKADESKLIGSCTGDGTFLWGD